MSKTRRRGHDSDGPYGQPEEFVAEARRESAQERAWSGQLASEARMARENKMSLHAKHRSWHMGKRFR